MSDSLQSLQTRLGHQFQDPALLELALTHPAFSNENEQSRESNQRLEFLGDAVLQLILSEELYRLYPADREGALTQRRKLLVEGRFTAELAAELELGKFLRVPPSATAVAANPSALEDAFEAVVAAIYLDAGHARAREVILALYGDLARRLATVLPTDNPKGRLQELVQPKHGNNAIRYEVTQTTGEAHQREFEVTVFLMDRALGSGRGPSKKVAEEAAATAALEILKTTVTD
ncbi:MAG: ribonuclease III [Opitutaceae bacterium]|nr:ribonuclease III [Opitutaceae bacterium]